jgi:hypothetical protein
VKRRIVHGLLFVVAMFITFFAPTWSSVSSADSHRTVPPPYDCSAVTALPSTECEAMVSLYLNTGGPNWSRDTDWLVADNPCQWWGATCTDGHLVELNLSGNRLNGDIPAALGCLTHLTALDLSWNLNLVNSIPPELGNLSNLESLALQENRLTGAIPPQVGNLSRLVTLDLSSNQLDGSIPPELGNLANLSHLNLSYNRLSGDLPPSLGKLANLRRLYLFANPLAGALPQNWTALYLSDFWFDSTGLCEPLDTGFQAWLARIDNLRSTNIACPYYLPLIAQNRPECP